MTILTSHASKWNMGLDAASLGGKLIATNDGPFVTNFQVPLEKTAPGVLGDDFGPSTISAQLSGTPEGGTVMLAAVGRLHLHAHGRALRPGQLQVQGP